MLQINSAKLFSRGIGRTNHLRGVLYSNLELCYGHDVVTAAGSLRETDGRRGNRAIVYEIDERIEAEEVGPGVLISHTIAPFLEDFSALATFGLRAIVSSDPGVVDRLTSTGPGFASYHPPSQFVRRYFDDRVPLQQSAIAPFAAFVDSLIGLDRRTFLAAMRAIRTFVSGLHRMRDDLALAYTLFVSAVESLAQDFDGHQTVWQDIDDRKRKPLDFALRNASKTTGEKVREAVLSAEHASLARRYRAFALSHIDAGYFRGDDLVPGGAASRHELDEALRQAYTIRSRYVHTLRQLPDAIGLAGGDSDVTDVDRRPVLTFQGLVRLSHHVITAFVAAGPKIERERYNYALEQSGVVVMPLAPQMWVGSPLRHAADARQRLEGHIEQVIPVLANTNGATITDLRPIFPDIERLVRSSKRNRSTLLIMYALFAGFIAKEDRSVALDAMVDKYLRDIGAPSCEALVARTLFGTLDGWSLEIHQEALDGYFSARSTPAGFHAPKLLEAAFCVSLAERYRHAKQYQAAQSCLVRAVETYPGNRSIVALEETFSERKRIGWEIALLPRLATRKKRKKTPTAPG
ncbi:hypothetical protein RMR10_022850 [Agrobacterium rosae]|uniref:hypothetical protein n=1 Tax=Agrobacterium rosae TaxID=1972867 RepID=UPI002A0E5DC9|nr:hypothetical protein [Agrobacterium rosae]MDX8315180.1 hypothetical protein [Agrobacterium rosae]